MWESVLTPQVIGLLVGFLALAAGLGMSAWLLERRQRRFRKKKNAAWRR